ncbi:cGMP-dependent protein kinase, isozyme 1-like [Coccinella septempunctata]|uniref:cGMP-dependent protein kinase, isozyme 1-like n=1 Tax=Coccinella septempunctata TaxID=41139 RepID=UPI001D063FD7|nr:cGMP-dependent protein kinase, isozyme 1-like [Coccinella septempunctata]
MQHSAKNSITSMLKSNQMLISTCLMGLEPAVLEHFLSRKIIYTAIQDNKFTKHFKPCVVRKIMRCMYQVEYPKGSFIMEEKQEGKNLFIVEEGKFQIEQEGSDEAIMGILGKLYGEEEFLMSHRRLSKIKAITNCKVWKLSRKVYKIIMKSTGENAKDLEILRNFPWFENADEDMLTKIANSIVLENFGTYEVLKLKNNTLYIINNGSVKILENKTDQVKENILGVLSRGDHFEGNTESENKMIAFYPGVELLTIDMDILKELIGERVDVRQETILEPVNENTTHDEDPSADIKLEDLEAIASLGKGSFGRVDLVRYSKDPNDIKLYALKVMEKHRTVKILQQSHVIDERKILFDCEHPFIIKLHKTFRDDMYIYMLFEACLGGQVWEILMKNGFFNDETSRFIAASAIEALDYLHRKKIIYRDLKTDNMVIDQNGYVKLVDFGLSKHLGFTGRTWSFCGTPCNIAPEIILNFGHDRAVDYWALGLMIYELLSGCSAFSDSNPRRAYEQIMDGIDSIDFSYLIVGRPAEDLIKKLCRQEPTERIGYRTIEDIREHRWFQGFDWKALISKSIKPPKCIVPSLKHPADISYVHPLEVDYTYTPIKEESNWDQAFE